MYQYYVPVQCKLSCMYTTTITTHYLLHKALFAIHFVGIHNVITARDKYTL